MGGVTDAVDGGVAHDDVGGGHVYLGAEHVSAVFELSGLHAAEQIETFLGGAVAPGAGGAGSGERAAVFAYFVGGEFVHVGLAHHDELFGVFIELIEVVGGVMHVAGPLEAQPLHVLLNGIDVFGVFLHGVGVVETQIAQTAVFLGESEIDADGLGMADVQIAVGFGRKTGVHASAEAAGKIILIDAGTEKIDTLRAFRFRGGGILAHGGLMSFGCCTFRARETAVEQCALTHILND